MDTRLMVGNGRPTCSPKTNLVYYAIGDVHGCADLLESLLIEIDRHHDSYGGNFHKRLVLLGDLIDRGPDSKRVIEIALKLREEGHIILPGNHEAMMAKALFSNKFSDKLHWLDNGGDETLASYGCQTIDQLHSRAPTSHLAFITDLAEFAPAYRLDEAAKLFFVHAGIDPRLALAEHRRQTFLWTRNPEFLDVKSFKWVEGDYVIVHGHTPTAYPSIASNRIGIDLGAVWSGRLGACAIENNIADAHMVIVGNT